MPQIKRRFLFFTHVPTRKSTSASRLSAFDLDLDVKQIKQIFFVLAAWTHDLHILCINCRALRTGRRTRARRCNSFRCEAVMTLLRVFQRKLLASPARGRRVKIWHDIPFFLRWEMCCLVLCSPPCWPSLAVNDWRTELPFLSKAATGTSQITIG